MAKRRIYLRWEKAKKSPKAKAVIKVPMKTVEVDDPVTPDANPTFVANPEQERHLAHAFQMLIDLEQSLTDEEARRIAQDDMPVNDSGRRKVAQQRLDAAYLATFGTDTNRDDNLAQLRDAITPFASKNAALRRLKTAIDILLSTGEIPFAILLVRRENSSPN